MVSDANISISLFAAHRSQVLICVMDTVTLSHTRTLNQNPLTLSERVCVCKCTKLKWRSLLLSVFFLSILII